MEFTTHKQRLNAMCAGEAPTRDMASLALYNAAKKALDECVVDVDGSLARKQELAALQAESQIKRTERVLELVNVDGRLINPKRAPVEPFEYPEAAFEQMLVDRHVPSDATWEEALFVFLRGRRCAQCSKLTLLLCKGRFGASRRTSATWRFPQLLRARYVYICPKRKTICLL